MIGLNKSDLEGLTDIYLVANTPMYLYRNIRKHVAVIFLADRHTPAELSDFYSKVVSKKSKSIEDVVTAYVFLLALTRKEYSAASFFLKKMDLDVLDWGEKIRDIFLVDHQPTTIIVGDMKFKTKKTFQTVGAEASVTFSKQDVEPKFTIEGDG